MAFIRLIEKRQLSNFDWAFVGIVLALCAVGLAVIYSAGFDKELGFSPPMMRQLGSMGIGWFVFFVAAFIHPTVWKRYAFLFYGLGCALLVGVLVAGVTGGGAQRWLLLGGVRIQPSEFVKFGVILALARVLGRDVAPQNGYSFKTLLYPLSVISLPAALVFVQPDLGTALSIGLIGGSMLLVAGVQSGTLVRIIGAGTLLLVPAWGLLKEYQRMRIVSFLSPESDPLGSGYHAMQSKIAVGSGAISGKGFLEGTQTQLRFLPEQTTDFIFSVLAEEWGFIGSISVLFLYALLFYRLCTIASRCSEAFLVFVSVGVGALVFWHMVFNIGMVIGVLPVVGITLPLLSFGGSSVVTILGALGIVAGASMRRFLFS